MGNMANSVDVKTVQCRNIAGALGQDAFADVTFVIGPSQTEFRSNRLLFGVISEIFKAMLFGSMEESKSDSVITIDDIDARGFKVVMDFAHCKNPMITADNLISIKNICRKYQISSLSPICDEHFTSLIDQKSFCSLLNDSINYKMDEYVAQLKSTVKKELGQYAEDMVKSVGFKSMGLEAMSTFLQFDELDITEEMLWDAVFQWKEYQSGKEDNSNSVSNSLDEPSRKKRKLNNGSANGDNEMLRAISPYMRFGLMRGTYFVDKVQPQQCLEQIEIVQIANYILCDNKHDRKCGPFSVRKRCFNSGTRRSLDFTLRMSSRLCGLAGYSFVNTAASLGTSDLSKGCSTKFSANQWIQAYFERPVIISEMEIAPLGRLESALMGANVQIYDERNHQWRTVIMDLHPVRNQVTSFSCKNLNATLSARIRSDEYRAVSMGLWKIYAAEQEKMTDAQRF